MSDNTKKSKKIVEAILDDLNGRKGCGIDNCDDDIQAEIKDDLFDLVFGILEKE
jgi:hypothetical protein